MLNLISNKLTNSTNLYELGKYRCTDVTFLEKKDPINKDYKREIGKFLCEPLDINFLCNTCNTFDFNNGLSGICKSDDCNSCD